MIIRQINASSKHQSGPGDFADDGDATSPVQRITATLGQTKHLPQEISLMQPRDLKSAGHAVFGHENGVVLRGPAVGGFAAVTKRGLDLLIGGLALLLLLPVLLLVALAIRIESPGPILFRQPRGGLGGQPFTVFKFRTMWHGAPGSDGSVQATPKDARVTRVGRVLRKTSIDELPQLLNVFNGTMSLVGPRPHPLELDRKFLPLVDRYSARHRVRPGITGWAQVNGARGETRSVREMERRVALDIEYIGRQSLAFDLRILLLTLLAVTRTDKAY